MRRIPLVALLAVLSTCLWVAATCSAETVSMKASFSPYRLGRSTTLKLQFKLADGDGPPPPVTRFDMKIPADMELIGSSLGLSVCQPTSLLIRGLDGCSPNAQLGLGDATIEVPVGPESIPETAAMTAEMGPPVGEEIGVLLYAEANTPVAAALVFPGELAEGGGTSHSLQTAVPLIPTLPGAPDVSMVSMNLSLGPEGLTYYEKVGSRTLAYRPHGVALPDRCPRGGFHFGAQIGFQDGTTASGSSAIPCPGTSAPHR